MTHTFTKNSAFTRISGSRSNTLQTPTLSAPVHTCAKTAQRSIEGADAVIKMARFVRSCSFGRTGASARITSQLKYVLTAYAFSCRPRKTRKVETC